jgi:hypothetical protein
MAISMMVFIHQLMVILHQYLPSEGNPDFAMVLKVADLTDGDATSRIQTISASSFSVPIMKIFGASRTCFRK